MPVRCVKGHPPDFIVLDLARLERVLNLSHTTGGGGPSSAYSWVQGPKRRAGPALRAGPAISLQ